MSQVAYLKDSSVDHGERTKHRTDDLVVKNAMKYSIVGAGLVGKTLAGIFARQGVDVLIANSRGPESIADIAVELGPHITPVVVDRALDADIIFFAVGFLRF